MSKIKSALEIAMEKVGKIGEPTEEERLKWKYAPEGERLAAKYLKENSNLLTKLSQYQENGRKYIIESAAGVLIRHISLPNSDVAKRNNTSEPFGRPEIIDSITGFVEGPSLSGNGKTLYFHKKDGSKHSIYKISRE